MTPPSKDGPRRVFACKSVAVQVRAELGIERASDPETEFVLHPESMRRLEATGLQITRVFDDLYVAFRDNATRDAGEVAMFDSIAPAYETTIDIHKNTRLIRVLLQLVPPGAILDYGCGTGLSATVSEEVATLIGFDPSPAMRELAESRGLRTVDGQGLGTIPDGFLTGAIASYALHLQAARDSLLLALPKIRPNGRFAANFHKGKGVSEASEIFDSQGFRLLGIHEQADHGPILLWEREA